MGAQGRKGWQASEAYLQQWYADSGQLQPSWAQVGFKPAKRAGWPQLNGYQQRLVSALEQVCGAKIEVSKPKAGQNLDLVSEPILMQQAARLQCVTAPLNECEACFVLAFICRTSEA